MPSRKRFAAAVAAAVACVWLGLIIGVSFLATPVKFQAPSLDLPVALEVGHVTFALSSRIEWIPALLLVSTVVLPRLGGRAVTAVLAVLALLAAEFFWLLPVLDARVEAIIAGQPLPESAHHFLFASAEVAKAVLLLGIAIDSLHRLVVTPQVAEA